MSEVDELRILIRNTLPPEQQAVCEHAGTEQDLLQALAQMIEGLIKNDFEALLFLLYRIDVSEQKVRQMMAATGGENAALTIAQLILDRQKQKLKWREIFRKNPIIPGEENERW